MAQPTLENTYCAKGNAAIKNFVIVEIADGLAIVELPPGQNPEDAAFGNNDFLVTEEIYTSQEEANDALAEIAIEEDHEAD